MTDWEKRARELRIKAEEETKCRLMGFPLPGIEWALQLGREMADERAEEIAKAIEPCINPGRPGSIEDHMVLAAMIARSFISKKRTREQVMEEALRKMVAKYHNPEKPIWASHVCDDMLSMAKRALEWKPE